eukprot:2609083-Pleurochrysis_carterae.AAC.1
MKCLEDLLDLVPHASKSGKTSGQFSLSPGQFPALVKITEVCAMAGVVNVHKFRRGGTLPPELRKVVSIIASRWCDDFLSIYVPPREEQPPVVPPGKNADEVWKRHVPERGAALCEEVMASIQKSVWKKGRNLAKADDWQAELEEVDEGDRGPMPEGRKLDCILVFEGLHFLQKFVGFSGFLTSRIELACKIRSFSAEHGIPIHSHTRMDEVLSFYHLSYSPVEPALLRSKRTVRVLLAGVHREDGKAIRAVSKHELYWYWLRELPELLKDTSIKIRIEEEAARRDRRG